MTEEDQYNSTVGSNWWDLPSSRSSAASSTTSSSSSAVGASGGYVAGSGGWVHGGIVGHGTDMSNNTAGSGSSVADYPNFMGLGLSSPPQPCWNQQDLLSEKGGGEIEGSFRSMLQEGMAATSSTTTNYHHHQQQETSMLFTSANLQGCCLFGSNQQQPTPSSSSLFNYGSYHPNNSDPQQGNYGLLPCSNESLIDSSNWSSDVDNNNNNNNKLPAAEFLRLSPAAGDTNKPNQLLQFTNNAPFWSNMGDGERQPVGFFPPLIQKQTASTSAAFEEKPKIHASEIQISSPATQKSSSATIRTSTAAAVTTNTKRSRSEGSSAMPPFKVRKEKMGDRITALQQLVSPFGKTDTASVLSEAIECIKFLHEQVGLLTTPYLKTGSSLQHQQQMISSCDKSSSNDPEDHHLRRQDLRSRGLCLVPVSCTFPVAHEPSVDFWTPTFGGTFR